MDDTALEAVTPVKAPADTIPKKKINSRTTLNQRQERWCQTYYATGDEYQAYRDAGYPVDVNSMRLQCYRLRTNPKVRERLQEMAQYSLENLRARRGQLIDKLMEIVNSDITEYMDGDNIKNPDELKKLSTKLIKSIRFSKYGTSIELYDKLRAIELLARISGLMVDRVDVTSNGNTISQMPVNITFEVVQERSAVDVTDRTAVTG